jgi:hypothetical protein
LIKKYGQTFSRGTGNHSDFQLYQKTVLLRKQFNLIDKYPGIAAGYTLYFCQQSSLSFLKLIFNGIVPIGVGKCVIEDLCKAKLSMDVKDVDISYQARLGRAVLEMEDPSEGALRNVLAFLDHLARLPNCAEYLDEIAPMLPYVIKSGWLPIETISKFLFPIQEEKFDRDALEAVAKILPWLPAEVKTRFLEAFKPIVVDYWQNSIQEEIVERDILGDFYDADDMRSAEALALKEVNEILSEYGIAFDKADIESIVQYVHVDDIIQGNIKRSADDPRDDDHRGYVDRGTSAIDDLFTFDLPDSAG